MRVSVRDFVLPCKQKNDCPPFSTLHSISINEKFQSANWFACRNLHLSFVGRIFFGSQSSLQAFYSIVPSLT